MIEFEVKITGLDIIKTRRLLQERGAVLHRPAYLQKNIMFHLPRGREIPGGWLRVRDEGDKITMSLKIIDGGKITDQREFCFLADSIQEAARFLELMGAVEKARSEKRRESWMLGECEIVIDEWPFLEPFIEVEGPDEEAVMRTVELLGFQASDCRICAVDVFYREKYGVEEDVVDNHTPLLVFDMENPFAGEDAGGAAIVSEV